MSWAVNLAVVIVQRLTGILADAIKLRHLVVKLIGNINSPSLPVVQVITPHYDYDDKARERINAAIIALDVQTAQAKATASIDWTTADNQDVKVTADDLRCVIAAVAQRSNALHVAYRAAKDKVEAATTVTEVDAVTLNL